MWTIIGRRLKRNKRGASTIIAVVLSLVIIVVIVSNIVLWSFEMNQVDWERMNEDVDITGVARVTNSSWFAAQNEYTVNTGSRISGNYTDTQAVDGNYEGFREALGLSYNPSGYTLGGSTSLVSGSMSNLTSDDGVYMTFRSYSSGTDTSDFVDNNVSDVDSSADKGTHGNFTAQQYADSVYDTLTEQGFSSTESAPKYAVAGSTSEITGAPDQNYATIAKMDTCQVTDYQGGTGTIKQVYFNITYYGTVSGTLNWDYRLDGAAWNNLEDLPEGGSAASPLTRTYNATNLRASWTWGNLNTTDIRFQNNDVGGPENAYVDAIYVTVVSAGSDNYELDLEVQWTTADYDEVNEDLCIYGGTMDAENIRVDVWNGSGWENLFTDLSSGWNNISVSTYLTSSTFTVRFKGGTESSDTVQDSWNIDVTLLHVWSDEYTTEVEFTGSSNTDNWNELNWTINSAWTIGSVSVTLQLYNYTLNDYPTSGNGYTSYTSSATANTDETKSQTITVNPTHFRNSTGYWRMKVGGVKATGTQFDFKADWVEFKPGGGGRLDMNGTFTLDLSTYPLDYIQTVEIQLEYRSSDTGENWYLKAYNWTATAYSDSGFNNTSGHTPTTGWDIYAVNLTDKWNSYVSDSGTMYVKLQDNQADANQTTIDIDFLGVRVKIDGTRFTFKNEGSVTLHMVSLWIINSTLHQHYDMDIIVNSAETYSYIRADISLPSGSYTVKVVTERGNKAMYTYP